MVAHLVGRLQRRQPTAQQRSPTEIVAEARLQAARLRDVPRAEIAARFDVLAAEICQQAIARGTTLRETGAMTERLRAVSDTNVFVSALQAATRQAPHEN